MTAKKMTEQREERRMSVKEYADQKKLHVSTVYRRIEAGIIKAEQPAPGYRVEIILS